MRDWSSRSAVLFGPPVLRALVRSWRFVELNPVDGSTGPPQYRASGDLYALWHQQILMLTLLHREQDIAVMISRSRDGDVTSKIVEKLGFRVVRGSSSRGGSEGLREMVQAAHEGHSLALTVDGPRGPARRCKPGAVLIGHRADVAIVPSVAVPVRALAVNSWDRFLIPAPGSKIFVTYGEPLRVVTDGSPEDLATWQRRIECELDNLVELCERAAGVSWPRSKGA